MRFLTSSHNSWTLAKKFLDLMFSKFFEILILKHNLQAQYQQDKNQFSSLFIFFLSTIFKINQISILAKISFSVCVSNSPPSNKYNFPRFYLSITLLSSHNSSSICYHQHNNSRAKWKSKHRGYIRRRWEAKFYIIWELRKIVYLAKKGIRRKRKFYLFRLTQMKMYVKKKRNGEEDRKSENKKNTEVLFSY